MTSPMPAAFIGHGSPMNTLDRNGFTESWRLLGASVLRPRAVLVVSAHWYIGATAVTAMPDPRTIHDFYGFPAELFAFEYPAPGAPDVADLVVETVRPRWVGQDLDSWGIDHGAWSVLAHVFPDADVPVVQLSVNAVEPIEHHLDLGVRLAPLLDEGVLVLASGNVVHNLGRIDWATPGEGVDWNRRFDAAAWDVLRTDPAEVLRLTEHPDHDLAVPTPDHFLPLLYLAGIAGARGTPVERWTQGYAYGSLSMASYVTGLDVTPPTADEQAVDVPAPDAPPEQTNI